MSLSDIVNVTVTTQNPGVTQAGFGTPMIVSYSANWIERTRTYASSAEVLDDFAVTTPEYIAAAAIFSQDPTVEEIKIGRGDLPATQRYAIGVLSVTAGATYTARIKSSGGTYQDFEYTATASVAWAPATAYAQGDLVTNDSGKLYRCTVAGTSAGSGGPTGTGTGNITDNTVTWLYCGAGSTGVTTNDAIVYGLQLALDALADPVVSGVGASLVTTSLQGSVGSKTLRILANTAGDWWAVQIDDLAALTLAQDHSDPGIATDLAAINLADPDWYGPITLFNSKALVVAAAGWCETNQKLYRAASCDSEIPQVVYASASDVAKTLAAASRGRTSVIYKSDPSEFADAASLGRWFPTDPGSENWRLKTLSGVTADTFTTTHKTNMTAKRAAWCYVLQGVSVVGGQGVVAANEYIDVVRGLDWWVARMSERLANLLIQSEKVPFTDAGVALVEAQVRALNDEGIRQGLISPSPAPTVSVPLVANVSSANKQARTLPDVDTTWVLAGAINYLEVNAAVSA